MLTSKEQHIIEALIEDELNTAKEVALSSNTANSVIVEYINTLFSIKNKFAKRCKVEVIKIISLIFAILIIYSQMAFAQPFKEWKKQARDIEEEKIMNEIKQ